MYKRQLINNQDFLNTFGNPTGSYLGIIVSIYTLGCFFGCVMNFFIGDRMGRRSKIASSMTVITIGVALQCSSFSVEQLMIGRFITGLGTGWETSTCPMYQAELSPPKVRGRLVCSEALFVGVGLIYAYWFDYALSFTSGPIAWRLPLASQIVFAFVVFCFTFTIPESPRYMFYKGEKEEAKRILSYVFGKPGDHPDILKEWNDINDAVILETSEGAFSWAKLFKPDKARTGYRVFLAYMSMFAQQLSGVNVVNYYITFVLINSVGIEDNLALILGGVAVICFTVGSLVPTFFADRMGRRLPSAVGAFGCGVCMMLISILLSFQDNPKLKKSSGAGAVAFFFVFQLVFGSTGNCIPWLMISELIPLHARAKGSSLATSSNWLWNFFVVEITPTIIEKLKWKAYLIFMCCNFSFVPMFYFFFPETKNLTLEAIDDLFSENRTIFMGLVDYKSYMVDSKRDYESVSYTHLDVYKRQALYNAGKAIG